MREKTAETINKIVSLRALAIALVVFGHSIILYSDRWGLYTSVYRVPALNIIKEWINLIQMPLFLSISGFLFARSINKYEFKDFILKKARRLLIPYFIFAIAWMYPIKWAVGYYEHDKNVLKFLVRDVIMGYDIGHLWFLPCLFLCFIFGFFMFRIQCKRTKILRIVVFIVLYFISCIGNRFNIIPWVSYFCCNYVWFYAGSIIYDFYSEIIHFNKLLISVMGIGSSILAVWCDVWIVKGIATVLLLIMLYNIVNESNNKVIKSINDCSFGIYLFHSPLIYITFAYAANYNPLFVVSINILFAVVSWGLTALCMRTKLKCIFGN